MGSPDNQPHPQGLSKSHLFNMNLVVVKRTGYETLIAPFITKVFSRTRDQIYKQRGFYCSVTKAIPRVWGAVNQELGMKTEYNEKYILVN